LPQPTIIELSLIAIIAETDASLELTTNAGEAKLPCRVAAIKKSRMQHD
jgi:hypothetical protein